MTGNLATDMGTDVAGAQPVDQDMFMALARARRSTRSWSPRPVELADVEALIEAARWAPSPSNRQPWKFLTIADKPLQLQLRDIVAAGCQKLLEKRAGPDARAVEEYLLNFTHFAGAPLLIAVQGRRTRNRMAEVDASDIETEGVHMACGMAMQNILLAAVARGMVACPMSGPMIARPQLEEALEIASPWSLMALIPVGWPGPQQPLAPERKRLDLLDLVFNLEQAFGISIPRGEFERRARERLGDAPFEVNGVITEDGLAGLREAMPEAAAHIKAGMRTHQIPMLFTVQSFYNMVAERVATAV